MFGRPEWFREKTFGWGLTPITWQGWVYTVVWSAIMIIPFLGLLAMDKSWESGIWMAFTIGSLVWDVRSILRAMRQQATPAEPVLYIDDEQTSVETRNFDLHLRR